jgi:uncharacterized damage-inducible protein DinB
MERRKKMQLNINITKEDIEGKKPNARQNYRAEGTFKRSLTRTRTFLTALLCVLASSVVIAQNKPAASPAQENPLSAWNRRAQGQMKDWLLRSAEKMPEENYKFKPADAVRSYGQIIGHIADIQYTFCSAVLGEKNPSLKIETTRTSKAELIAGLKDAFAYCDKAYDGLTDAAAAQMVKHSGIDTPKLFLLNMNIAHAALHYGNLITYMRLKNIVPPSTDDMNMRQLQQKN